LPPDAKEIIARRIALELDGDVVNLGIGSLTLVAVSAGHGGAFRQRTDSSAWAVAGARPADEHLSIPAEVSSAQCLSVQLDSCMSFG
jgi:hypothetical protein